MKRKLIALLILFVFFACGSSDNDESNRNQEQQVSPQLDILLDRNDVIWGFDFLPDESILFTQRSGQMFIYHPLTEQLNEVSGLPSIAALGEGGLLDVRVHPNHATNHLIYFCFSAPSNGSATPALAMAELTNNSLSNVRTLVLSSPSNNSSIHFGCRIEFDDEGHLFFSIGERNDRDQAQSLSSHLGKILRLNLDGSIPADNPFANSPGAVREVYSLGHRNPQGMSFRSSTNELWAAEHGPRGGDEVNIIEAGANYGWPRVSHGTNADGSRIGVGTSAPGLVDPITFYVPSIAPSAITFYDGEQIPAWRGNLFLATLAGQHIRRLTLDGSRVVAQEELFEDLGWRFRNIRQGPDGLLYFSTDEGRLVRINPE